tara:strand:- start:192 stop:545 length:354 start_codon:yes stop_codon:yes gene_type:complete
MFRSLIVTTAFFATTNAFGVGPECDSQKEHIKGNCIKISDCTTNEWTFGSLDSPVCDEPGADYKVPDTKVCCFDKPKKGAVHSQTHHTTTNLANAHHKPALKAKKAPELKGTKPALK